ncbi:MAG: LLM class flavin-dependent oxidoreductase, partial [Oceanobacter sp.]
MPESTTDLSRIPFSILELASVPQGSNIPATLKQVIRHAQQADLLGFHRIWLAEHHNLPSAVSSATSVLIAQVAAQTRRLKVGSGGIMLANHSPLVIAEQFGTLEALHPGRIDLGLGRAPTYDPVTARALRRDPMREDHFAEEVEEVRALLGTDSSNRAVQAWPGSNSQVPVFLLGSSLFTARIAARKGLPYAFAGHLSPRYAHEALSLYRQQFQPSDVLNEPYSILTLPAVAAETDEQAEFLATTLKQKAWNLMHGKPDRLTPPIADLELNWDQRTVEQVDSFLQLAVIGSPSTLRRKLSAIVEEYPVNELMFTSDIFDAGMRIDALQHLIAAKR